MYVAEAYVQCSFRDESPVIRFFKFNEYLYIESESFKQSAYLLLVARTYRPRIIKVYSTCLFSFVCLLLIFIVRIIFAERSIIYVLLRLKSESVKYTVVNYIICGREYLCTESRTVKRYYCCCDFFLCMIYNALDIVADYARRTGIADKYSCRVETSVSFDNCCLQLVVTAVDNVIFVKIGTEPPCAFHFYASCCTELLDAEINTVRLRAASYRAVHYNYRVLC